MSYPASFVEPLQRQLAHQLKQIGAIRSPAVYEAFCVIPRHEFLPYYYEQQGRAFEWCQRRSPDQGEDPSIVREWLTAIYANRARTTLLDEEQCPISSSSQPSLMAHMLEELQVERGMRVLEIGTGSGYNSGLLAHLTGDPALITTIDINANLVQQAQRAIDMLIGPGLQAYARDGVLGVQERAPFDRVIATARAATIPDAWIEQLAPGGRLVMDLGGRLAGGLLVAQKAQKGSVSGSFLPVNISFMAMQSSSLSPNFSFRALAQCDPKQQDAVDATTFSPFIFHERDFRFFLQWNFPGAILEWWGRDQDSLLPAFLNQETLLTFVPRDAFHWTAQVRGPDPLWQQVMHAFRDWDRLGCPSIPEYRLTIESSKPYQKHLTVYPKGEREQVTASSFLLA